jgi:type II secretory pathway component PulJ
MLELLIAGVLLGVLMTVCVQMLSAAAAQRRAADDRQTAIREAANLMERLSTVSFDKLTPEGVAKLQLSDEARRALPGGELEIQLSSPPSEPGAKRIVLLLRWQDRSGRPVRPVRLTAWRFQI